MSQPIPESLQIDCTARIRLAPADWAVATWRPRQPVTRPQPGEFDHAACLAHWRRICKTRTNYYMPLDWSTAFSGDVMTPAEAHFWLVAMTDSPMDNRPGIINGSPEKQVFTGQVAREEILQRLRQRAGHLTEQIVVPLANLLQPEALLDLLLDDQLFALHANHYQHYQLAQLQPALVEGLRRHVLPYLDDAQFERLRQVARKRIDPSLWSQTAPPSFEQQMAYRLAPVLGLHKEILTLVSSWPDNLFPRQNGLEEWRRQPHEMIFGLGSPWLVEQHMRRLQLLLRHEQHGRAWLAHTELAGLEYLAESVRKSSSGTATRLVEVLCLVEAPQAARLLLELRLEGYGCSAERRWFHQQVGNAVAGLLPSAAGRGKFADAVRHYLREVNRRGLGGVIETHLQQATPAVVNKVRATILQADEPDYPLLTNYPLWWRRCAAQLPTLPNEPLPEWLHLDDLPPLLVNGHRIGPAVVQLLVRHIQAGTASSPPSLFVELRKHVEPACREAFVWRLFEQWQCAGMVGRNNWPLHAIGWLGDDESVLKLVSLIRECTGPRLRSRALVALECLQTLGSPLALQQLTALSRQLRSRPLRERAKELVEEAAARQGLSRTELEDRAVPTLGFEEEAGPQFDYGGRQFRAVLTPNLRLVLRDAVGSIRQDLPPVGLRDNANLARQAIANWRLLRKSVQEVFKEQAARFERAMINGQRWPVRHLHQGILRHPLLRQLARLILWGGYDDRGRLTCTFRITDELTLVDADEEPVSLLDCNSIRVVHPVELSESQRRAWDRAWRDHELQTPFAQLGRRLFLLDEEQRRRSLITEFAGRRIPALMLTSQLKALDWRPTIVQQAQPGEAHCKLFAAYGLLAVLHHPNVGAYSYPSHLAEQELRLAFFLRQSAGRKPPFDPTDAVLLGEVPDLVRSEVCEVMASLYARGKV